MILYSLLLHEITNFLHNVINIILHWRIAKTWDQKIFIFELNQEEINNFQATLTAAYIQSMIWLCIKALEKIQQNTSICFTHLAAIPQWPVKLILLKLIPVMQREQRLCGRSISFTLWLPLSCFSIFFSVRVLWEVLSLQASGDSESN